MSSPPRRSPAISHSMSSPPGRRTTTNAPSTATSPWPGLKRRLFHGLRDPWTSTRTPYSTEPRPCTVCRQRRRSRCGKPWRLTRAPCIVCGWEGSKTSKWRGALRQAPCSTTGLLSGPCPRRRGCTRRLPSTSGTPSRPRSPSGFELRPRRRSSFASPRRASPSRTSCPTRTPTPPGRASFPWACAGCFWSPSNPTACPSA
mmetsp:Transcript_46161/g.86135  ORF Transcript_46161/g.86135 Transcript_46161/m.86135 type:complete len:201 (+) Transcript_46161:1201-1803(+)